MRILVVEDERRIARALKRGLEQEGYAVDVVLTGENAKRVLLTTHEDYDLVILDLMLPGIGGIEVCMDVRAAGVSTPVLMLTARDSTSEKVLGMDSGADDYLVKPFDFDELLARMRMLLRRPHPLLSAELTAVGLVLDTAGHRLSRDGLEISLTAKELVVLELFMRNPNQVLSRDQIVGHAWDARFDSSSNVVDVHVKNLRRKISDDKGKSPLETVRGLGYRFRV